MWTIIIDCANAHTCCEVFLVPAQSKERPLCLCAVLARTSNVLCSLLRRLCIINETSLIRVLCLWRNMMCTVDCLHFWSCTCSNVFACCVPLQQSESKLISGADICCDTCACVVIVTNYGTSFRDMQWIVHLYCAYGSISGESAPMYHASEAIWGRFCTLHSACAEPCKKYCWFAACLCAQLMCSVYVLVHVHNLDVFFPFLFNLCRLLS